MKGDERNVRMGLSEGLCGRCSQMKEGESG